MNATSQSFSKIIDIAEGAKEHFHVPKYQREYSWGHNEWEHLLQDIDENDPGYFMGPLVCVHDASDKHLGDEVIFEVVDGQQRLTTLSLMLMAIYANVQHAIKNGLKFVDEEEQKEIAGFLLMLEPKFIKKKKEPVHAHEPGCFKVVNNTYFLRVQPSEQNHNLEDYKQVLVEAGLLKSSGTQKPKNFGNRTISRAFCYFRRKLPADTPQQISAQRELAKKIDQLKFVSIIVNNSADAFALFESLNNRGVPLSATDIIKNKLLAAMQDKEKDLVKKRALVDDSFERWQEIINAVPEVDDQQRFLRHFYNAFKHRDEIRVDASRATKGQIIHIYEQLIKKKENDPSFIFEELVRAAKVYGSLLNPSEQMSSFNGLHELERIGGSPAYQILLYLFSRPNDEFQPNSFHAQAVTLLCRYYVRRNVTEWPLTRDLDAAAIEVIEDSARVIADAGSLTLETFASMLLSGKGKPASLETLAEKLRGSIYADNAGMARYLLTQIDALHSTREYKPDLWERNDKGKFIWTVEHVLPQTDKLPMPWVQMIGAGETADAATVQGEVVDRLGNLTLSGYNSSLSTSPFDKKQQLAKDQAILGRKIDVGYRNGLALNNLPFEVSGTTHTLATAPVWTKEMIGARTEAMVKLLLEANKLPGE